MIQLISIIIAIFVITVFLGIALATGGYGYSIFSFLLGLVFTGYIISDKDGLIIIGAVYNTNTSTWVYNTSPIYPFWAISMAMITLLSIIITMALITHRNDFDSDI